MVMLKGVDIILNHFHEIVIDEVFSLIKRSRGMVETKNAILIAVFVVRGSVFELGVRRGIIKISMLSR